MAEPAAIEARGLTRSYGDVDVVRALSFSVRTGEVVGFLGHNGAGKSTTMRMLAGALAPTAGAALIFGAPSSSMEARASVGFLPETPPLTAELTVHEQLAFVAGARFAHARVAVVVDAATRAADLARTGVAVPDDAIAAARASTRAASSLPLSSTHTAALTRSATARDEVTRVISLCDLASVQHKLTSTLSKGTKQRVGLAQALIGDPPVLLLDEPTAGLDLAQAALVRELIKALAPAHAIVLSTHLIHEVTALCSRAVLIKAGALVADDSLAEMRARGSSLDATVLEALA